MTHMLLDRRPHQGRPALTFLDDIALTRGRVHELCGRARRSLALVIAARLSGPVIWISHAAGRDTLNAQGVQGFINPGRLIFVTAKVPGDVLWTVEEVLRAGAVPLVVADLPGPPALTPVRRMHLAAEAGTTQADQPPLGLLLTPGDGGAPGVESRWQMEPAHSPGQAAWQLTRLRARTAPPRDWIVTRPAGVLDHQMATTKAANAQKRPAPVE